MRAAFSIWWRAFSIVTMTALNVTQISGGHYPAAFATGGTLSFIWWKNTRTAAHSDIRFAQAYYAFGAACGTMLGMYLGRTYGK